MLSIPLLPLKITKNTPKTPIFQSVTRSVIQSVNNVNTLIFSLFSLYFPLFLTYFRSFLACLWPKKLGFMRVFPIRTLKHLKIVFIRN